MDMGRRNGPSGLRDDDDDDDDDDDGRCVGIHRYRTFHVLSM